MPGIRIPLNGSASPTEWKMSIGRSRHCRNCVTGWLKRNGYRNSQFAHLLPKWSNFLVLLGAGDIEEQVVGNASLPTQARSFPPHLRERLLKIAGKLLSVEKRRPEIRCTDIVTHRRELVR